MVDSWCCILNVSAMFAVAIFLMLSLGKLLLFAAALAFYLLS
jgi:hypothetical protein